jgi:hypothetical protein
MLFRGPEIRSYSMIIQNAVAALLIILMPSAGPLFPGRASLPPGVLIVALIVVSVTEGVVGLRAMGSRLIRWRLSWVWYALA